MDDKTPDIRADAPAARDMVPALARRMSALNSSFYREQAASFSDTRHGAWPGWQRCLDALAACDALPSSLSSDATMSVLDLACGNLRFVSFLSSAIPDVRLDCHAVDNCVDLAQGASVPARVSACFHELDIVGALLEGPPANPNASNPDASNPDASNPDDLAPGCSEGRAPALADLVPRCDLVVSFGFLHHVPTRAARAELMRALVGLTNPGGACCVSLWRFMSDATLAARALATTAEATRELGIDPADLGEGDYLLGWQGRPHAFRYCHSFGEGEVDALVAAVADEAELVARFDSDGRSGALNTYLVLRRKGSRE